MRRLIAAFVSALLFAVGCTSQPSADSVATAIVLTQQAQPTATPLPEPTATPTPLPTATATPAPLTPTGIFESLSPAVVRIEADSGFGSGVLIEGNYILTNAHVVWPAQDAIVTFPDGTTLAAVPVVGVDLLADLAVLGPVETDVDPLALSDNQELAIGDTLLLIGYPGDVTSAPKPTLTETLISRLREQETFDITYFQVSAPVAGGQSGGIAVTMDGEVVGLTGNRITEAQYGLIAAMADIRSRVDSIVAGQGEPASGRGPDLLEAADRHFVRLHRTDEMRIFTADLDKGTELEVTVDGNGDALMQLLGPTPDDSALANETSHGIETIRLTVENPGTYYLLLGHFDDNESYTLKSNVVWTPYLDPDDGQQVSLGETYEGVLDTPYDADTIDLTLGKDQIVNIHVSSLLVDPVLLVRSATLGLDSGVEDDNSGGGLFDTDAELTFQAPSPGLYKLIIIEPTGVLSGGYQLEVREAYEGAPTPIAFEPTPTPIVSPFGELTRWESDLFPFAFAYPAEFEDISRMAECPEQAYRTCFADALGENFIGVVEFELGRAGAPRTLDEMAQSYQENMPAATGMDFVGREDIVSALNEPALIMSFAHPEMELHLKIFSYMLDSDAAISIIFIYQDPAQEELIDYVFSTFEVTR